MNLIHSLENLIIAEAQRIKIFYLLIYLNLKYQYKLLL